MADTSIINTQLPYTGIQAVDAGFRIIAQQMARTSSDVQTILDTEDGGGDTPTAPTNAPAPTGISVVTNSDGSMDVTLTWNYADGTVPADFIVLFWKQGTAALPAPTSQDKALLLAPTARVFTFQGWNPNSNYRFGVAAGAKTSTGSAIVVGAILSPDAAPDWADVSATGNYTALIDGTPAVTIEAQAAAGQTAYNGTVNYRSAGAPTNLPAPAALSTGTNADGSARYIAAWNYTQGANKADGFLFFVKEGDTSTFNLTDPHFELGAQPSGSFSGAITLKGYPPELPVSLAVAAFRRTELGIEIGAITSSAAAPDWIGISTGTPNYAGTIFGVAQHNFTLHSGGAGAEITQRYARVTRDGTTLQNGGRSYNLVVYDPVAQQTRHAVSYDLFGAPQWAHTLARDIGAYNGRVLYYGATFPAAGVLYCHVNATLPYTIGEPSSFYLVYDLQWRLPDSRIAFDLECSDSTNLRDSGAVDQYGRNCHPATALPNSEVFGKWYRRRIQLPPSFAGKTITRFMVAASPSVGGTVAAWIRGVMISTMDTRDPGYHPIWIGYTEGAAVTVIHNSNPGGNVLDVRVSDEPTVSTDILMLTTLDEPQAYRLTGSLPGAVAAMGGSPTLFNASSFQFGAAYALVGTANCGPGNGLERYAGTITNDPSAAVDLTFQTQGSKIVALSGTGWQPDMAPGVPTNNPVPTAASIVARDSGSDVLTINWQYTQPALSGTNKPADGFVVAVKAGNDASPGVSPNAKYEVGVDAREFVMESPYQQQWSFGVAAFRRTSNGVEVGAYVTSAGSPDWQGIGGNTRVGTGGINDGAVTDPKVSNLSAAKITTGLLTIDPTSSGATGIMMRNAATLRIQALSAAPAMIVFEDNAGVEGARITGDTLGYLYLFGSGGGYIRLGNGAYLAGAPVNIVANGSSQFTSATELTLQSGAESNRGKAYLSSGLARLDAQVVVAAGTKASYVQRPCLDLTGSVVVGAFINTVILYDLNGNAVGKLPVYGM